MGMLDRFFRHRERGERSGSSETAAEKPFLDHLEDLRWTLIKMIASLVGGMVFCFAFRAPLVEIVQRPLREIDPDLVGRLMVMGVTESFTVSFQLSFFGGVVAAFPFLLYFAAEFLLPALTRTEKRYLLPGLAVAVVLFLAGVIFCYHGLLPPTLRFFFKDAQMMGWMPMWTVREYFSFVAQFVLALGFAFELPVGVLILVKAGLLSHATMVKTRILATVAILGFAAFVSPTPDPFTFLAFGLPMWGMYEGCIGIAWLMERAAKRREAEAAGRAV